MIRAIILINKEISFQHITIRIRFHICKMTAMLTKTRLISSNNNKKDRDSKIKTKS